MRICFAYFDSLSRYNVNISEFINAQYGNEAQNIMFNNIIANILFIFGK